MRSACYHAGTGKTVIVNSGLAWQIVIDDPELAGKVMIFKSLEKVDAEIDDDAK